MYNIEIKRFIDAAHRLPDSEFLTTKKCQNLHGHTYLIVVNLSCFSNKRAGMVIDFGFIKDIIDTLDHSFINDIFESDVFWRTQPTTAENIAKYYARAIMNSIPMKTFETIKVSVCEGYKGDTNSNWIHYQAL